MHKKIINNSQDDMSPLEASNPIRLDPENYTTAEAQDKVLKIVFMYMIKFVKEGMKSPLEKSMKTVKQ